MKRQPTARPTLAQTPEADLTRPNMVRIGLSTHRNMRLRPIADYFYARTATTVAVVAAEMGQAALSFPLAFAAHGDVIELVALLALTSGRNLFVSESGAWLSDFVPSAVCTYPFVFRPESAGGRPVLLADANSGLIQPEQGEALFTDDGKPSDKTRQVVKVLKMLEQSRKATQAVCAELMRYKLLVPWGAKAGAQPLRKLQRVDEGALNRLPQGIFQALRQAGALPLIYAHLLSLALLPRLLVMERIRDEQEEKRRKMLSSCFSLGDDTLGGLPI